MVTVINHDGNYSLVEHDGNLCVVLLSPDGMKPIVPFDSLYFEDEINQIYDDLTIENANCSLAKITQAKGAEDEPHRS